MIWTPPGSRAKAAQDLARATESNPSLQAALKAAAQRLAEYCRRHSVSPDDVSIASRMTPRGRLIVTFERTR